LRMEDLDGPRAEMHFADAALADLEWLGLDWDGPVLVQSSGLPRLNATVAALIETGKAYPCVCSRGDIRSAQSAPHAGSPEPRYPGTCRGRYSSFAEAERQSGRAAGARLMVAEGTITIEDGVAGSSTWDVASDVGDFLIAKRDKAPAYQLAVVVDDHAQGVTEVLRGADLLPSAARQWHVQNCGHAAPTRARSSLGPRAARVFPSASAYHPRRSHPSSSSPRCPTSPYRSTQRSWRHSGMRANGAGVRSAIAANGSSDPARRAALLRNPAGFHCLPAVDARARCPRSRGHESPQRARLNARRAA